MTTNLMYDYACFSEFPFLFPFLSPLRTHFLTDSHLSLFAETMMLVPKENKILETAQLSSFCSIESIDEINNICLVVAADHFRLPSSFLWVPRTDDEKNVSNFSNNFYCSTAHIIDLFFPNQCYDDDEC